MQVRPELAALGVSAPPRLDPYLARRDYAAGERLMAQGTSGDECYLIVSGEVRLEVERPAFDSDGVIASLGPGVVGAGRRGQPARRPAPLGQRLRPHRGDGPGPDPGRPGPAVRRRPADR